ncbi:copper resistance system multicopper oxidase [Kordiimonas lipolytica]|uniref:Copper resistance system multicopper oxidase n=1 Tax=Kordiimonas lipolytica TaxID=1662421 RepID=A0ABV8UBU1_9PROT|nr:copper resistance system multicopper oxidase [Kordiimonas lipolytica]
MSKDRDTTLSKRQFVKGVAATVTAVAATGFFSNVSWAKNSTQELTGKEFHIEITPQPVNFTGKPSIATVANGTLPGPILRVKEGDMVTIHVTNKLSEMTTIHWHGIILDAEMDGVPGISFPGIEPGETFVHKFKVVQNGTYWYHAHTLHEQTGLYGALIVEPRIPSENEHVDRDYPVILSDWTDEEPIDVYLKLKKMGGYYNYQRQTVGDFVDDIAQVGLSKALSKRSIWNKTRMSPTDFSDISAATYTYLMNGHSPNGNWTGTAKKGERIRLRFIGAGTATYFDVRIPGLKLTVVSTDGQRIFPVVVDEFRIGAGETYDVIVTIPDDNAYTIFAQSMDRSGYARGTLSPKPGLEADVPSLDDPVLLEPIDMMGSMAQKGSMASMAMKAPKRKVNHARTEYGAAVDMRINYPRVNLDDPGPGLRNNGRRVLTYADMKSVDQPEDTRQPSREIELHLTGNMERFIWSIDGLKLNEAKPLHFPLGERIRVILHNDSTMAHPMHLHGMWSDLEAPDGTFQVRKHTISVQPAQSVSMLVTVDAEGRWAFHCHLLYHMAAGMFREVVVA